MTGTDLTWRYIAPDELQKSEFVESLDSRVGATGV